MANRHIKISPRDDKEKRDETVMKIGLVVFEIYPAGLKQLINKVISEPNKDQHFFGIELERDQGVKVKPLLANEEDGATNHFITASPVSGHACLSEVILDFDAVIVIGKAETKQVVDALTLEKQNPRLLFVPVSILNDIPGSDASLGYDTAINSIVEGALKIQDTIHSVKYDHPRLFGVGVPGIAPDLMLSDLALAAEGFYVSGKFSEQQVTALCKEIQANFTEVRTSSILFYNEALSSEWIKENILSKLKVDWKASLVDEALCMGSHPTAIDRILARKLADQISLWLQYGIDSGQLLIMENEVAYQELGFLV